MAHPTLISRSTLWFYLLFANFPLLSLIFRISLSLWSGFIRLGQSSSRLDQLAWVAFGFSCTVTVTSRSDRLHTSFTFGPLAFVLARWLSIVWARLDTRELQGRYFGHSRKTRSESSRYLFLHPLELRCVGIDL